MSDVKTINTYNKSAKKLAEYFKGIGPRTKDIELAIKLAKTQKDAKVVEIGCGDGRDAQEIVKRVGWYEGFDPSSELLNIARAKVPVASFVLGDALSYTYPSKLDIVFAFASLLHVNKTDLLKVFKQVAQSLRRDGVLYISLKERSEYVEEIKKDEYGERMFYYYNPDIIRELSQGYFHPIYEDHQIIGHTNWFTIALSRI